MFDCVVVITDRRVLDRQLQDAIYQIEHAQGGRQGDRPRQPAACGSADRRHQDRDHHAAEVSPSCCVGLLRVAGADTQEAASAEETARAKAWEMEIAKRRYAVIVDEAPFEPNRRDGP